MARTKRLTQEEKVAKTMTDLVRNLDLDLDLVGVYIAQSSSALINNRLSVIIDSAIEEKERQYERAGINPLF